MNVYQPVPANAKWGSQRPIMRMVVLCAAGCGTHVAIDSFGATLRTRQGFVCSEVCEDVLKSTHISQ